MKFSPPLTITANNTMKSQKSERWTKRRAALTITTNNTSNLIPPLCPLSPFQIFIRHLKDGLL